MRLGILIVGSLYWDCCPVRCAWRQNRLSRAGEHRVKVPIRYGRRSDKRGKTFTMVFARSCSEPGRLGTGIVVPALTECVRPEQLIEEAEHLWTAEGGKKANISDSWGAVCILQNPSATLPQEILNAWQARIRAAGDLYVALPTAKGEEPVLDAATGRALYEWPTDDKTNQPLSGFDLLLMTATKPTLKGRQYETAKEIANAWRADKRDHVLYFHNNRHYRITTFEDEQILSVLRNTPPKARSSRPRTS